VIVEVRFEPTASDTHTCTIETGSELCDNFFCTGVGEQPATCLVSPDTLKFGTVALNDSLDLTFFITNIGGDTLRGDIGEICDNFSLVSGGEPFALTADETVFVVVRFIPTENIDYTCTVETGQPICADMVCTGYGDPLSASVPARHSVFALHQNHPNPFNPTTTIAFSLPEQLHACLIIYDLGGRRIRTLVNGVQSEGVKQAVWDGKDSAGNPVSSGVYFYRLKAGGKVLTKKMVLLK
jgi:hypothetical protein